MQVEIDFEVFKALTAKRVDESHTYNDVIRELLGLTSDSSNAAKEGAAGVAGGKRNFESRDLSLPHGTLLRATYKGRSYAARIEDGRWIDDEGVEHSSPSAAARHITGNNVNGLRFWQGKRPNDTGWLNLDILMLF
jgi:hypothetical protein